MPRDEENCEEDPPEDNDDEIALDDAELPEEPQDCSGTHSLTPSPGRTRHTPSMHAVWLEQDGEVVTGRIDIYLTRGHGGQCKELIVSDEASGMGFSDLRKAIEFSGETSGFKEGRSVRGFFGRGLKESIIALGRGEILTLKDKMLCKAEIYYEEQEKDAKYKLYDPIANKSSDELLDLGFSKDRGTVVKIIVVPISLIFFKICTIS